MALIHSPKLPTDNLVVCVDAGNTKSYPGSGTNWLDLSGNNNTATLTNSPTFNSERGGSIVLNGTNQYVLTSGTTTLNFTTSTAVTYGAWIYPTSFPSFQGVVTKNRSTVTQAGLWLFGNLPTFGGPLSNLSSPTAISLNTWYYLTAVQNGNTGRFLYVNGVSVANDASIAASGNENIWIGGASGVTEYFFGRIANVHLYSRALSAKEVADHYNNFRGRFGI